ncbi:MAG: hypothetical protein ABI960_06280 [Candidatus Eisenbacteria bacterium]
MSAPTELEASVSETLIHGISGKGAHLEAERALDGLDWRLAEIRPGGTRRRLDVAWPPRGGGDTW